MSLAMKDSLGRKKGEFKMNSQATYIKVCSTERFVGEGSSRSQSVRQSFWTNRTHCTWTGPEKGIILMLCLHRSLKLFHSQKKSNRSRGSLILSTLCWGQAGALTRERWRIKGEEDITWHWLVHQGLASATIHNWVIENNSITGPVFTASLDELVEASFRGHNIKRWDDLKLNSHPGDFEDVSV